MTNKRIHIIVIEPSQLISEGLLAILGSFNGSFDLNRVDTVDEIPNYALRHEIDIVFINPSLVQNNNKTFSNIRNNLPETKWIGIVYSFYESKLLTIFDETINVYDTSEHIINLVTRLAINEDNELNALQEKLSDREIEVLKLLASGNQNKEIADKLNISTHTVISHRKNISQKTGIKSVSGLTIYAVVKNIMTLENLQE
jgi:DNA-binding NarL/FixJ family response regulator